jgi:CheY-like chemotaxis protein
MDRKARKAILLVDQDGDSRDRLKSWLEETGYDVVIANSGNKAVNCFMSGRVGLVLFAFNEDDLNDLAAIARIRETPHGSDIPVVSLYEDKDGEFQKLHEIVASLSVTEFIKKSVDFATFTARMQVLLPNKGYVLSDAKESSLKNDVVPVRELRELHARLGSQNHYERLGLIDEQRDDLGAIRVAYGALARRYSQENFEEITREVRRLLRDVYNALGLAYTVLSDSSTRNEYNLKLGFEEEKRINEAEALHAEAEAEVAIQDQADWVPPESPPESELESAEAATDATDEAAEPDEASGPQRNIPEAEPEPPASAPIAPTVDETPEPEPEVLMDAELTKPIVEPAPEAVVTPPLPKTAEVEVENAADTEAEMQKFWDNRGAGKEAHEKLATAAHLQAVMGDYKGAVELYEQCVKLQPDNDEYIFKLELARGRMHKKDGNKSRARGHFEAAAALEPGGTKAAAEELEELESGKKGSLKELLFSKKK